jgi:hypothetical protein
MRPQKVECGVDDGAPLRTVMQEHHEELQRRQHKQVEPLHYNSSRLSGACLRTDQRTQVLLATDV